ncbi:MAG: hypothetical protein NUV41_06780 [Eubacteriales bacterium]|nr:hypothetical protein [Eubacteriales bacterium]
MPRLRYIKNRAMPFLAVVVAISTLFVSHAQDFDISREREIRDKIQGILSSGEFSPPGGDAGILKSIADRIKDFADWLKSQVDKLKLPDNPAAINGRELSAAESAVLKITGIFLILAFIGAIFYFIKRNLSLSKNLKQREDNLLLTTIKDYKSVEQRAFQHYQRGEYRLGIRFLYIALLLRFNEVNLIRINKSKTNSQYLKELFDYGFGRYETVRDFTLFFNESWYGNREVDREKFEFWLEKYNFLLKVVET